MKAAVLHELGQAPRYEEFDQPIVNSPDEILIRVTAASIKNLDKGRAAGTHYDKHLHLPAIVGVDGVGITEDGKKVYTGFADKIMAEYAVVNKHRCIPLPDGIDDITAAALPNPGLSAWFTLTYRANIQPGEKVLIMGATGVTGKMAVQLAKLLGAGSIITAGRNQELLDKTKLLGADKTISLLQTEEQIIAALKAEHAEKPFDIVIDYLWGRPAEMVLSILSGHSLNAEPHRVRYIQVGEMAGRTINLYAATLRSSAVEIYGIGGGTVPMAIMKTIPTAIMPKLVNWLQEGKLEIETEVFPLADVEYAWKRGDKDGKRIVIKI